jgi:hypothetical protein
MAEIKKDSLGYTILGTDGRYKAATEEQAAMMEGSPLQVAFKSATATAMGIGNLVEAGSNAYWGNLTGAGEELQQAVGNLQTMQSISEMRPGPAFAGEAALELAGGGALKVLATGKRAAVAGANSTMRQRIQDASEAAVIDADPDAPTGFGSTSAGAAQVPGAKLSGPGKFLQTVSNLLYEPANFNADQLDVLRNSLDVDVGFSFPPSALSNPGLFAAIGQKNFNTEKGPTSLMLGLSYTLTNRLTGFVLPILEMICQICKLVI